MSDPMVERLLAYEEIRQLAARYAVALDACDLDSLVKLFVPDVQVGRSASGAGGAAGLLRRVDQRDPGHDPQRGHAHDRILGPDDAKGVVYCRGEIQEGDRWIVQAIQYRDEYQRRDGHWYFLRRKHLLWYGRDIGTSPLGLPPANWPAHSPARASSPRPGRRGGRSGGWGSTPTRARCPPRHRRLQPRRHRPRRGPHRRPIPRPTQPSPTTNAPRRPAPGRSSRLIPPWPTRPPPTRPRPGPRRRPRPGPRTPVPAAPAGTERGPSATPFWRRSPGYSPGQRRQNDRVGRGAPGVSLR